MDYNPRSPQNIGMEWVPIQQADFLPDNFTEYGYVMRIDHSATIVSGGLGINVLSPEVVTNVAEGINVYPDLTARDMGPVRMVTIPVQAATVTGVSIFENFGNSIVSALANPMDFSFVVFLNADTTAPDVLGLNFGVTAFSNELSGKRIVKLRLVYTAASDDTVSLGRISVALARAANSGEFFRYQLGIDGSVTIDSFTIPISSNTQYNYVDLGDWNPMWTPGQYAYAGDSIYPWRYTELAQLDTATSIASRLQIILWPELGTVFDAEIGYMALQVFYCEETRVAYGGRRQFFSALTGQAISFQQGENRVPLKSTAYAASTTLTPGNYLVTATNRAVSNSSVGKLAPSYAAIQQLNETPPVAGRIVKPTIVIDDTFEVEETEVITDISLFTAVAAVTGTHSYSNQIQAPVYGTVTATQDVHVRPEINAATSFSQVRFYARRVPSTMIDLRVAVGAATASISVDEFDALDEIIDGWKEVTLTLSASVSLTGDTVQTVIWSAPGTTSDNQAGSQWQVLGASMYTTSPNINVASYDPPGGASTELTWKSPNVLVSTLDAQSDATVLLAQSLPAPTSLVLTTATQELTGVAEECGVPNDCVLAGITYVNLAWNAPTACDNFDRDEASGFGTSTSGDVWTLASFTGTSSVDGERGVVNLGAVNDNFTATIDLGVTDQEVYAEFSPSVTATGASIVGLVAARFTDTSNFYSATAVFTTTNALQLQLGKRVAGVLTSFGTLTVGSYAPVTKIAVVLRVVGTWIYGKCWNLNDTEPVSWQFVIQDTSLASGTRAGVQTRLGTGNTNALPVTMYVDNFYAQDARYVDSRLEIQRQDDLDGDDWQTILDATNYCFTTMQDYEARVGTESRYRARYCDSLDFCGPWVSGAATPAAPGVTGSGSDVGDSVLIFTSNRQPLSNLAYTMVWNGQPVETFVFPEVDTQLFQRLYGRDFQVAFRPLERGGESFERIMLVQAAAIPIPSLANFTSLRDLAWADLPYVCVRDELGNRWYANVLVPQGQVTRGRRLYLAQLRVTEVTDEAAPVT